MIDVEEQDWETHAINQLRKRFLENDDHWIAIFESDDLPQILYEDKREWYVFLISQEGYGK